MTQIDANDIDVPILGGHSEKTIFPMLDDITNKKTGEKIELSDGDKKHLFDDIRNAGDRILEAYHNKVFSVLVIKSGIIPRGSGGF